MLRSGCRWSDTPPSDGPHKTCISGPCAGPDVASGDAFSRQSSPTGPRVDVLMDSTQAIGRSQGGRTTKLHALSGGLGRPLRFLPTGGQAAEFGR